MTQPTTRNQSINYFGFLSKELGDLRGAITLAHELIQNADDAKNDAGELSASRITFDVRDDALVVSNDAVFREIDFHRMEVLADGTKREEEGHRTTGAFGVGFISVYQVTDRPEIQSSGRRWILRPEKLRVRIDEFRDPSITKDKGTVFRLPWAFGGSRVRRGLKVPPVDADSIDAFVEELKGALPTAILFLKKLDTIELRRNGEPVRCVTRVVEDSSITIEYDGVIRDWRIIEGDFAQEALEIKAKFSTYMDSNREDRVRIAIRDTLLDNGVLSATLPTEQSTGLPFHIDADFFPAADRKSIAFEDSYDHRSEWNRAAIRAAASMLRDNLIPMRDMFSQDASTFWAMLGQLHKVYDEHRNETRRPLGAFWEALLPVLRTSPIVYTESGQWLASAEVRITTGEVEKEAVQAFGALGIETVHLELGRYRNILTSTNNGIGVRPLRVEDIYEALDRKGMVKQVLDVSPLEPDLLKLLCTGIHSALERTRSERQQEAITLLRKCALAPAVGGGLWSCESLYRTDESTYAIFATLGIPFSTEEGIPLLERLCDQFDAPSAIVELEAMHSEDLDFQSKWRHGQFDPVALLGWFDTNRRELVEDEELAVRLAGIPVFPSTRNLRSLKELWLPGGFDDPLGDTDLVDMKRLRGLSDFLRFLGARELTFLKYAEHYVSKAFAPSSAADLKTKRKLLGVLTTRIGEIRENNGLKMKLASANIVECTDGKFRGPNQAYFPGEEVRQVFGSSVHYARLAENAENRTDFYRWLGVANSPRPQDIKSFVDILTKTTPTQSSTQRIKRILEVIGKAFPHVSSEMRNRYGFLQTKAWLPSVGDSDKWYRPDQLYAIYNKSLFESQAQFLDLSLGVQRAISDFLAYLGVNRSPETFRVVNHLLECSRQNVMPPKGIYEWLNNVVEPNHLRKLVNSKCLRVEGKYLRPDQVFWGQHLLGRFRVQLGEEFRSYQKLLSVLGIREAPDYKDAIQVLKEVSVEVGHNKLEPKDEKVVRQCWVMLSEALEEGEVDDGSIRAALNEIDCVPNIRDVLQPPAWTYFEDRPGLADKFTLLRHNVIVREERVWLAMAAAGVSPVSEAVQGFVQEAVNQQEDERLKRRVMERVDLIRTISNDAVQPDGIRFIRADQLKVNWRLEAFKRTETTQVESALAHLEKFEGAIYFTLEGDNHPWSAIARELTLAIAPGAEVSSIAPGIRIILEANSLGDAVREFNELGIAQTQELGEVESEGSVAVSFEEVPPFEGEDEPPPRDRAASGGEADEDSQVEVGESEGIESMLADAAVDAPARSSDGVVDGVARPSGPADTGSTSSGTGRRGSSAGVSPGAVDETVETSPGRATESEPFAKVFFGVQTFIPSDAPDQEARLPAGGPKTDESAMRDTHRSGQIGRSGAHVRKPVTRWEPTEAAKDLADKFRDMTHSDYVKRCQVCGKTFAMSSGESQVFVVHVVPPSADNRTNHFGNLMGLCGWHYALVRYGEWAFVDHITGEPGRDWKHMRDLVLNASEEIDEADNLYIAVPARFSNTYQQWNSERVTEPARVRYSIPHWKYLCKLLKT